jgi:DNA-directed RNA polymerase subunit RPC12/RpoP
MTIKCDKCGKIIELFEEDLLIYPENMNEKPNHYCKKCYNAEIEKIKKEHEAIALNIKCPYCERWFPKPISKKYRKSAEGYIECPHCKMKIMQGINEIVVFREEKMKEEKYPINEGERARKRLSKLNIDEEKYEETQDEENKRIQKDDIIDEEEDEEKEEEDKYTNYSKKETYKIKKNI